MTTTTTSISNAVAAEAEANMKVLMAKGQSMDLQSAEGKAVMAAWNNEYVIKEAAELLVCNIERAKRDLDDALRMVEDNEPECLSHCGVFQDLIHDMNTTIAVIKTRRACRGFYGEWLK